MTKDFMKTLWENKMLVLFFSPTMFSTLLNTKATIGVSYNMVLSAQAFNLVKAKFIIQITAAV